MASNRESSNSFSSSAQSSSSEPFAPEYLGQAAQQTRDMVASAQKSATDQKQRLSDYINHLYAVQALAKMAAKGAAARGANGQQNPLSVYKAMNALAAQAGIPMDAEISKALQQGDSIENTLNALLGQAAQVYAHLGSVMKSQSQGSSVSQSNSKGSATARVGGNGNSQQGGGLQKMDPLKDLGWNPNSFAGRSKLPPGFEAAGREGEFERQQDDLTGGRSFAQDLTPEEQAGFDSSFNPGFFTQADVGNPYDAGMDYNSDYTGSGAFMQAFQQNQQMSQQLPGFGTFNQGGGMDVYSEMPPGYDFDGGNFNWNYDPSGDRNFSGPSGGRYDTTSSNLGGWTGQDYMPFQGVDDSTNEFSGYADQYSYWV